MIKEAYDKKLEELKGQDVLYDVLEHAETRAMED